MISSIARAPGTLQVFSRADLNGIHYSLTEILYAMEAAYKAHAAGSSDNPGVMAIRSAANRSAAYAMLGREGQRGTVAMKSCYEPAASAGMPQRRHTSLLLFDDASGLPLALMDGDLIDALRAPAASALIARECAQRNAECVLLAGGRNTAMVLPFLATAMPQLQRFILHGADSDCINEGLARMRRFQPRRLVEISTDLRADVKRADIVIAALGPRPSVLVRPEWLRPGALCIAAGQGLHPDIPRKADYRVATSAADMRASLAGPSDENGLLPEIDAELAAIISGARLGRCDDAQRVFAHNGGMVIADIALGRLFAERAYAQGLGCSIPMW